ncbi:MAG TPA: VCBS repeat-containing protein, partial [Candidatus Polarisedimenticolia bacterium]|nr:VCBS repeat-containing protein [Candidatus Polarisedimenticolia bacterium]
AVRLDVGTEEHYPYGWTFPMGLASGDFDGDARNDLVVAVSGLHDPGVPGTVRVLRGLPGGVFAPYATVGQTEFSASVAVADLDADGDADIAVADVASYTAQRPGGLFMLLNDGSGAFLQSSILASGIGPYFVQVADMTGDGIPDLVASANAGYTAILAGLGGGAYAEPIFFGTPGTVVPGDFDGDGFQDLLVVSYLSSFVMLNQTPSEVPLQIDAAISFTKQLGRGSGTLTFTTNVETDLVGFNVLEITAQGTTSVNRALIPCEECTSGLGATYTFLVPRHRSGRNFYVEAVHAGGGTELFGPARRE